jgi:copper resistance protein C
VIRGRDGRLAVAVLGLSVLLTVLPCAPALAHAELEETFPEAGATLSEQPEQIRLEFDEPVRAEFDPIKVTDEDGNRVDAEDADTLTADPDVVVASLQDLPEDSYTVEWRVTSADGDPIGGEFEFAVRAGAVRAAEDGGEPAVPQEEQAADEGFSLVTALGVLVVGAVLVVGFVALRRR